jgi:hypothetical protein
MAYTRGDSKKIIVGAAALFIADSPLEYISGTGASAIYSFSGTGTSSLPAFVSGTSYKDTLADSADWSSVGYTMNGLELQFQPDFGEVQVDQLLDVAKLYKQGMQVSMVTGFAEATLDNLVTAIAAKESDTGFGGARLNLSSGEIGDVPVERALVAVGPGSGDPLATGNAAVERIYVANRALSIENVSVSAKRDTPSMFEVTFRLLSASNGSYGKIVDRTVGSAPAQM